MLTTSDRAGLSKRVPEGAVRVGCVARLSAVLLALFGCGDGGSPRPEMDAANAATDAAPQEGARDSGPPSDAAAGEHSRDSGAGDAGRRDAGPRDAGARDAMPDAATDAAQPVSCDVSACPLPDDATASLLSWGEAVACCAEGGGCGLLETNFYVGRACLPLTDGVADASCLDADANGTILEGCCTPDGWCGQFDPNVGCHQLLTSDWYITLRRCGTQVAAEALAPNPFACIYEEAPCTQDWECCQNSNYGSICDHDNRNGFGKDVCSSDF